MKNRSLTDPFAMMMNPQAVLLAVAESQRLQQLRSRVYRPLDKPMLPRAGGEAIEFDTAIEAEDFADTHH